jgi:hypothetical protein
MRPDFLPAKKRFSDVQECPTIGLSHQLSPIKIVLLYEQAFATQAERVSIFLYDVGP